MTDTTGSNPATTDIVVVQYLLPPLQSGYYQISTQQAVATTGPGTATAAAAAAAAAAETFTQTQRIFVKGPRTSLGATAINSVFPPANNQGEFSNVLAHVVLNNATLPWQRSPDPDPAAASAGGQVPSWLAVLLFDQNDPPPSPQAGTLSDLTQPPAGTFFPAFSLEDGEAATDPVTYIDVPVALFNAITPSTNDLGWLAHVRQVDPSQKPASAAMPAATGPNGAVNYSVVFGNRLPTAGNVSTAFLVSLENYQPYLPDDGGNASSGFSPTPSFVRLVCLYNWSFTAIDLQQTFAGLLTNLNATPSSLQLPFNAATTSGNAAADTAVGNAFGMGYTAMNHTLADGSPAVSWYRGPLVPLGSTPVYLSPPYASADQLLRYDPTTGFFDVSYAAAWQVGQLLALQSNSFACALYRWKLTGTQAAVAAQELAFLDQQLPPATAGALAATGTTNAARTTAVIKSLVRPAATQLNQTQKQV